MVVMSLRTKLFLLLLVLSLGPIVLLRFNGARSIYALGDDLEQQSREALTERARSELQRLVQDHALVLKREDSLVHMALLRQARAVSEALATPEPGDTPYFVPSGRNTTPPDAREDQRYVGSGMQMIPAAPLLVNHDMLTFIPPGGESPRDMRENYADEMARLAPLARLHKENNLLLDDLALWSVTVLNDGLAGIHPAHGFIRGLRSDPRDAPWFAETLADDAITFSLPFRDLVTGQAVLAVSVPVKDAHGAVLGVTGLVLSVDSLLGVGQTDHSHPYEATTLLVHAMERDDGSTGILEIASSSRSPEMSHRRWMIPDTLNWVDSDDEQFPRFVDDIIFGHNGIRTMDYQGEPCLWAYSHVDDMGTILLMILPEAVITARAEAAEEYVEEAILLRMRETTVIMAAAFLVVILAVYLVSRTMSDTVGNLLDALLKVADGDFTARAPVKSRDEFGLLAETFNRMVPALADQVRMKKALEVAKNVQQNLLPATPPVIEGLELAGGSDYCDETGGDFYDYFPCPGDNRRTAIAVGDVSGHGVPAALLMASARSLLRCRADRADSPSDIVNDVNRFLCDDTFGSGRFLTLFFLSMVPGEPIRWVRAGHDPAILFDPGSSSFSELRGEGIPLGVTHDYIFTDNEAPELSPGQILVLGTDGIWEMRHHESGKMFGKKRLKEVIAANAAEPAYLIHMAVLENLALWQGNTRKDDDVTLVVIKRCA